MKLDPNFTNLHSNLIMSLCDMQNDLNNKMDSNWKYSENNYMRAAHAELSEAMNYTGWEWWKVPTPNLKQYQIELIDALHFVLSGMIIRHRGDSHAVFLRNIKEMILDFSSDVYPLNSVVGTINRLEFVISSISNLARNNIQYFKNILSMILLLCFDSGMDLSDIVIMYVGKNTLNKFRKLNGYKEGKYIKTWDGQEDNVFLEHVLNSMKAQEGNKFIEDFAGEHKDAMIRKIEFLLHEKYQAVLLSHNSEAVQNEQV